MHIMNDGGRNVLLRVPSALKYLEPAQLRGPVITSLR